jgi:hypothetical protein
MMCADLIVCRFLQNVMAGASLGTALLDSKQRFLADINKEGRMPDAAEEKTLLQFVLLGDPSLHVLPQNTAAADEPSMVGASADSQAAHHRLYVKPVAVAAAERRSRRTFHFTMGRQLREMIPERAAVHTAAFGPSRFLTPDELARLAGGRQVVHRVSRTLPQPELTSSRRLARAAMSASVTGTVTEYPATARHIREETLQYYWFVRTPREHVIDATMVKVETDANGTVLRKRTLVTA